MALNSASELGHTRGGLAMKGCAVHSALRAGFWGSSDEGVSCVGLGGGAKCLKS